MLKGIDWLMQEETFSHSQNHPDLLLVMGQIKGGRVSPSGPASPGEEREQARRAAIAREKEGETCPAREVVVACTVGKHFAGAHAGGLPLWSAPFNVPHRWGFPADDEGAT